MTAMKKFWALCLLLAVGTSAFGQTGEPAPAENAPEQSFAVVNLSVCNMRRTPDFDAEMISQALLGTPVHVLAFDKWYQIQSPDTYK